MQQKSNSMLFIKASLFFIISLFISSSNDVLMRFLGERLDSFQVAWFRFFFGTLSLLPFMLYYGKKSFYTSRPFIHFIRGALLFVAVAAWSMGLSAKDVPFTLATTMSFTVPIFVLILAYIFLKEKIALSRWAAAILGLFGILVSLEVHSADFNIYSLVFLISVIFFASLDIINKVLIVKESTLAMLFYSALVTTIIGFIPAILVWQNPTLNELFLLFILGAGGNLILYFILKAFALVDVSALAPLRYVEIIFSTAFAYFLFHEQLKNSILLGCAIIIPATLFLAYTEAKKTKFEKERM
ncbi:MAG: DMT family transporter [Alphaproteobacteria bacterium]|nr:DMT family transporter [Alphaproteobacteria bacterium]